MTTEKHLKAVELTRRIKELEDLITNLKPRKARSVEREKRDSFANAKLIIKMGYQSAVVSTYGHEEYLNEEKNIEIPGKMVEFLYRQYLNQKCAELHLLKTEFEKL